MITKWFVLSVVFSFVGDLDVWSDQSRMCDQIKVRCVIRWKLCDQIKVGSDVWSLINTCQLSIGQRSFITRRGSFLSLRCCSYFHFNFKQAIFFFPFFCFSWFLSLPHIVKFLAQLIFLEKYFFSWKMLMIPLRTFNLPVNEGHKFQGL